LLSARAIALPSARRELLQALLDWTTAARKDPGVRYANVYEDVEVSGAFGLLVAWKSATVLEVHVRSDSFGALLGALQLLAQSTQLSVTLGSGDEGTDAMAQIRRLRAS